VRWFRRNSSCIDPDVSRIDTQGSGCERTLGPLTVNTNYFSKVGWNARNYFPSSWQ